MKDGGNNPIPINQSKSYLKGNVEKANKQDELEKSLILIALVFIIFEFLFFLFYEEIFFSFGHSNFIVGIRSCIE